MSRKRIFEIIEVASKEGEDSASAIYDLFMMAVIVLSLIPLAFKEETTAFFIIDKVCAVIFIIDYILRLGTADYKFGKKSVFSFVRYPFSFMAIIDLISILPSLTAVNAEGGALAQSHGYDVAHEGEKVLLKVTKAWVLLL